MKKFLEEVVDYFLAEKNVSDLEHSYFVLPSRRACYYFKRTLAQKLSSPVVSPVVISMDDFIVQASGLTNIDSMELLFEVFGLFQEIDPSISLNRFLGWGSALIKDFDTIDQALLESPKQLFAYMSEAKALERWNVQVPSEPTDLQKSYFSLFENIYTVYVQLHEKLKKENKAYRGYAYRYVAENAPALLLDENPSVFYYFIGLNALSKAEEKIVGTLVQAKRALTLWDTDVFYMHSTHKAGQVLRSYKKDKRFGEWNWEFDYLKSTQKEITIYPITNASLQAKLVADLTTSGKKDMAWVLSDDQILPTLLPSLPDSVDSYNITMGVSLKQSIVYSWLETLFQLQMHKVKKVDKEGNEKLIPMFHVRDIRKCLEHPLYVRYMSKLEQNGEHTYQSIHELLSKSSSTVNHEEFDKLIEEDELAKLVFKRWKQGFGPTLLQILDFFRDAFKEMSDSVETEFLYQYMLQIQRLETVVQRYQLKDLTTYKYVLFELIKQGKIPFAGEPIADLQVMSMLETRCLDFEHICLLSVNEGTIPSSKVSQSLIPFDASAEFHLPMYRDQDSIMSYHFFRLMQRANKIDIMYVLPSKSGVGGGGERSRFIRQIENELAPLNAKITVSSVYLSFDEQNEENEEVVDDYKLGRVEVEIEKTDEWTHKLKEYVEHNGLSFSSINRMIECELKFYYNDILKLRSLKDKDEVAKADTHGNMLHKVLERVHEKWDTFTSTTLSEVKGELRNLLDAVLEEKEFYKFNFEEGYNLLVKEVVLEQLKRYFDKLEKIVEEEGNDIKNVAVEESLEYRLEKQILGSTWNIKLTGRIDKVEKRGEQTVLIDYKTGKVEKQSLNSKDDLLQTLNNPKKDKYRQLWFYLFLYSRLRTSGDLSSLRAQISSMRNIKEELTLTFENITEDFAEVSESFIESLVVRLLDKSTKIVGTNNTTICMYCDFKVACKKDV